MMACSATSCSSIDCAAISCRDRTCSSSARSLHVQHETDLEGIVFARHSMPHVVDLAEGACAQLIDDSELRHAGHARGPRPPCRVRLQPAWAQQRVSLAAGRRRGGDMPCWCCDVCVGRCAPLFQFDGGHHVEQNRRQECPRASRPPCKAASRCTMNALIVVLILARCASVFGF